VGISNSESTVRDAGAVFSSTRPARWLRFRRRFGRAPTRVGFLPETTALQSLRSPVADFVYARRRFIYVQGKRNITERGLGICHRLKTGTRRCRGHTVMSQEIRRRPRRRTRRVVLRRKTILE